MALLIIPDGVFVGATEAAGAALFGALGWAARNLSVKNKLATAELNREATEKLVRELLPPALAHANNKLLERMNGTYLRSSEARIEFHNIKQGLNRLDQAVTDTRTLINEATLKILAHQ